MSSGNRLEQAGVGAGAASGGGRELIRLCSSLGLIPKVLPDLQQLISMLSPGVGGSERGSSKRLRAA